MKRFIENEDFFYNLLDITVFISYYARKYNRTYFTCIIYTRFTQTVKKNGSGTEIQKY